jgi:predicted flap endonuclease-1-like 5' DNA nuclease
MTKKTATKTGNKVAEDKILSNVTLKKINSKLMSTKENLESQVKDLSKQVKKLSKKSGKKSLKLLKNLDANYHRRLVHLQSEFEEGLASLSTMQDKVLERLPNFFSDKSSLTQSEAAKSTRSTNHKTPVSESQPKVVIKTSTIASIKGIGPVMQKKLAEEGITTLSDIANTPKNKVDVLKKFEKERGFNTWKEQSIALLAK